MPLCSCVVTSVLCRPSSWVHAHTGAQPEPRVYLCVQQCYLGHRRDLHANGWESKFQLLLMPFSYVCLRFDTFFLKSGCLHWKQALIIWIWWNTQLIDKQWYILFPRYILIQIWQPSLAPNSWWHSWVSTLPPESAGLHARKLVCVCDDFCH